MAVTTEEFKADENLIVQAIMNNTTSLYKSLCEAVMNSVDAGATEVVVDISETGVTITDDGRGFQSDEEVSQNFNTFGRPHEQDKNGFSADARYGTFRTGRGQLFAYGRNTWRSGVFQMVVDIRKHKLKWKKKKLQEDFPGCRITIDFYRPVKYLHADMYQFKEALRYLDIPVFMNGEMVSQQGRDIAWTHEDDRIRLRVDNSKGTLSVYNDGIHVRTYTKSEFGVAGILLAARNVLQLNTTRNDMVANCKGWQHAQRVIEKIRKERASKNQQPQDSEERAAVFRRLAVKSSKFTDIRYLRIFQDVSGGGWSLTQIRTACDARSNGCRFDTSQDGFARVAFAERGDLKADKLIQSGRALVFDLATLGNMGGSEAEAQRFFDQAFENVTRWDSGFSVKVVQFKELAESYSDGFSILPHKLLSKREIEVMNLASRMLYDAPRPGSARKRVVHIGSSDTAYGWTDGYSFIAIDRRWVKNHAVKLDLVFATSLACLLLHELAHDGASNGTHVHNKEFYEKYHNYTVEYLPGMLKGFVQRMKIKEQRNAKSSAK